MCGVVWWSVVECGVGYGVGYGGGFPCLVVLYCTYTIYTIYCTYIIYMYLESPE